MCAPRLAPCAPQWLLTGFKMHPIEGLMYLSPACIVWLGAGALVCEGPKVRAHMAFALADLSAATA